MELSLEIARIPERDEIEKLPPSGSDESLEDVIVVTDAYLTEALATNILIISASQRPRVAPLHDL
jgi:hypothetical protein